MAVEVVTSSMLSDLVAYLKANCYTVSEIGAAAQTDLETLSNSSIAISSVKGLIRRTDTASGGVTEDNSIVDNVHVYGTSHIYEYYQSFKSSHTGKSTSYNYYNP